MAADPFPPTALEANRSGRLTPEQVALYRAEAASDRRNLLFAGIAIMGFGAVILFGAVSGRIPGGRLEPLAVGGAILAFGAVVAWFGGIRGSQAKAAAAAAGRVTSIEGPFRRDRRDRRDTDPGHISPGNEYEYYLLVGDRPPPRRRGRCWTRQTRCPSSWGPRPNLPSPRRPVPWTRRSWDHGGAT